VSRDEKSPAPAEPSAESLALIREALRGLRFGQIVVTVHDGVVAQVDRTEKLRPPKKP
jgi:hypothetical protein